MTQNERVLAYLTSGRTLTSGMARTQLKISRLPARIHELRAQGNVISTTDFVRRNGARAVKYSLVRKAV